LMILSVPVLRNFSKVYTLLTPIAASVKKEIYNTFGDRIYESRKATDLRKTRGEKRENKGKKDYFVELNTCLLPCQKSEYFLEQPQV